MNNEYYVFDSRDNTCLFYGCTDIKEIAGYFAFEIYDFDSEEDRAGYKRYLGELYSAKDLQDIEWAINAFEGECFFEFCELRNGKVYYENSEGLHRRLRYDIYID